MRFISEATDPTLPQLRKAVGDLQGVARANFGNLITPRAASDLGQQHVADAYAALSATKTLFSTGIAPGFERDAENKPFPVLGSNLTILGFTDCVGNDTETETRITMEEAGILKRLGVRGETLDWKPTERLNPAHIRAVVTSAYLTYLINREEHPEREHHQLILLGNAAPRAGENEHAKGCPFVVARLRGDVFYVGTLNEGGVELQGVRNYVEELWHTTLGVEETGTNGGKESSLVFRSRFLLPLFQQIAFGNGAVMDRELSVTHSIRPIEGVQVDSRDTFKNLKLTETYANLCERLGLKFGNRVLVTIRGKSVSAKVAKSHGDGGPGELLLVPGSSPHDARDRNNGRADLVVNNGEASRLFETGVDDDIWAGRRVDLTVFKDPVPLS